jgi:hypothetical protein
VQLAEILDVFEQLLTASGHPDIVSVRRYGTDTAPGGPSPAGVAVKYQSGSHAFLAGGLGDGEIPIPVPDVMPGPKRRASRLAVFAVQLLDVARPAQFKAWRLIALPDVGPEAERGQFPAGVSVICADGTRMLLLVTAGSGPAGDPAEEPFPGWTIPAELAATGAH